MQRRQPSTGKDGVELVDFVKDSKYMEIESIWQFRRNSGTGQGQVNLGWWLSMTYWVVVFLILSSKRTNRSKKQGAYGRVPTIKAGKLAQLSHVDEVTPRYLLLVFQCAMICRFSYSWSVDLKVLSCSKPVLGTHDRADCCAYFPTPKV